MFYELNTLYKDSFVSLVANKGDIGSKITRLRGGKGNAELSSYSNVVKFNDKEQLFSMLLTVYNDQRKMSSPQICNDRDQFMALQAELGLH